jgi:hypothetical protein
MLCVHFSGGSDYHLRQLFMTKSRSLAFAAITIAALAFYVPFLAIQYDSNGIVEAVSVETGRLVNKNHMLYRPLGLLVWHGFTVAGYTGRSYVVLQTMTAVASALGVGFAYLAFTAVAEGAVACAGAFFLATSFTYWVCATDVFYVPLAGMFAAAALACILHARSGRWLAAAAVLTAMSVCAWQASVFLIPALMLVLLQRTRNLNWTARFGCIAGALVCIMYVAAAFASQAITGPSGLWLWFTQYTDTATLPIWGRWEWQRMGVAAVSALDSVTPVRLGASPAELLKPVQLGRIAVDVAVLAFGLLIAAAIRHTRPSTLPFLAGYLCFLPFITWWDPVSHKWFLVPNIFLSVFLVGSLAPHVRQKYWRTAVVACVLVIAGTNFVTTIRPRHFRLGVDRATAECVAAHMKQSDLFITAQWGWPDYLAYLHGRTAVNVINDSASFAGKDAAMAHLRELIQQTRSTGSTVYTADPHSYSDAHLQWLQSTTGVTLDDLLSLGGSLSFSCYGVTIRRL